MGITIGAQLGSHQITALLGRGGMGEVYRAPDAKLKREVAIKILPDEFSRDPERLARFQREAGWPTTPMKREGGRSISGLPERRRQVADFDERRRVSQVAWGTARNCFSSGNTVVFTGGKVTAAEIRVAGSSIQRGVPRELFDAPTVGFGHGPLPHSLYTVSLDGQRFLIARPETNITGEASSAPMTVVLNWTAGLTNSK
jgi:hypothetical protein